MKRWLVAVGLVAVVGALWLSRDTAPPPGFTSIRAVPMFQAADQLASAWALPVAQRYPYPVLSQTNPSACGPTSVANVLRSWGVQATADEVATQGSRCWRGVCFAGLTLDELAETTRAMDASVQVTVLRPASAEALREALQHANDADTRLIANFHRAPLFGKGGGHHSPLGGYVASSDAVFVLDVNDSFGPWLVSTQRLFEAMNTVDSSSGQTRGLLVISKRAPP